MVLYITCASESLERFSFTQVWAPPPEGMTQLGWVGSRCGGKDRERWYWEQKPRTREKKQGAAESPLRQELECRITKFWPNSEKARTPQHGLVAPSDPAWSMAPSSPCPKLPRLKATDLLAFFSVPYFARPDPALGPLLPLFSRLGHFPLTKSCLSLFNTSFKSHIPPPPRSPARRL